MQPVLPAPNQSPSATTWEGHAVDRRSVLAAGVTGVVGLVAGGGVAAGAEQLRTSRGAPARLREASGAAGGGQRRALGQRRLIWSVATTSPLVALTFDDGPDPDFTPRILDALAKAGVHATFNVMGYNAGRHPDLLRVAVAAGHEIGNHTWTHLDLAFQTAATTAAELRRGVDAIQQVTQVPVRFFRPPRGELTGSALAVAAELSQDVLLWSLTRGPAGVGTPAAVADYVATTVQPGDVLGLHDGIGRGTFTPDSADSHQLRARRDVEVRALPDILARVADRGLRFVPAGELVATGT
jgi:peptidoglycan/xylan/chitin deacetylase (PgdA/CDA1 family)